ncbi:FGGY-family carbohydrate kinase [Yersinia enterocolitica]|uniref:FGGY-family carbohydrate kinase n=1 Tax=Yersinia enterocolitica TaxID=630 RepID=UPI0005FCFFC7|nr:FGGY-family carbohydrate kinase [Yersinia enterocolitica]EKN5933578.1 carbohydrate kinase [Yersinia enterocolitica]ELX2276372.1 carbohydrate kinase [Yersinia enterocolitica]ELY5258634.1 carbohydrate kinase [Yersinia enterocolitica]CRE36241.1 putative L-xylulose kinase [Yersinia enterocolitica]HDL6628827.1 carbohydrate kinase [Yersinia enterocolitica]
MSHYFLGIDLGGTVTKAGIYTAEGREIAVTEQALPVLSPQAGFCERDMEALWAVTCQVIHQTLNAAHTAAGVSPEHIRGISFSAHGKGLYLVDKQGQPVRHGIVSSDSRAQALVSRWQKEGKAHQAYELSLQQLWPSHPAALLRWLKENEAENYHRSGYVLMAHDYIRYRLTGEFTTEETNISGSNLYNQYSGNFDPQLMKIFGIEEVAEKTAPIIGSAELAGYISQQAAQASGLKRGTPVFGGMFDVVGAALTSGLHDSHQLSAVAGTWSIATRVFEGVQPSDYPYVWGKYCIPGTYFVHEGSPTSASNLAWFVQQFLPNLPDSYQTLNQWAALGYEKSEDILFFPWLYGSNHSANLSGGLLGLSGHHTTQDIVYAIYQGIVFSHLLHQDKILALGDNTDCIRFTGGPTHSAIWMQIFCDASNLPLEIVDIQQSGCRAAALCAAVGSGYYSGFEQAIAASPPPITRLLPNAEKYSMLRARFEKFKRIAEALSSVM